MVAGVISSKRNYLLAGVLILAVLLRTIMALYYFDISGDKIYQTAAASAITQGKGYTVPSVNPMDLNQVLDKPMILWPPMYSLILAPVMMITENIPAAVFIIDLLTNIIFLLLICQVCRLLGFPLWLTAITVLYKATEINEIITASTATDYMALDFWLATILFAEYYLRRSSNSAAVVFIALNALAPWLRYASIPVVPVIPVAIIMIGLWQKNRQFVRTGSIGLMAAIVSTGLLLFFNQNRSGSFFYVLETTKGFYPENLLHLPPIAWTSLVNTNFILTQISLRTGIYYGTLNDVMKMTSAFMLIALIWYIVKKTSWLSFKKQPNYFFFLTTLLSLATIGSLALLSITRSRLYLVDRLWTYIEDHRYMLIVTTTLLFYLLFEFAVKKRNRIVGQLLVLIMIGEIAHGVWVMAKKPLAPPGLHSYNSGSPKTKQLLIDRNALALKQEKQLILVDEDYDLRGFAILNNITIMDDPQDLKTTRYASAYNKRIFLRIGTGHEALYENFLSQPGVREIARLEKATFYELDLPAGR